MNSIMNGIFGLVTYLFPHFFSFQVHQLSLRFFFFKGSLYVYFVLVMYAYIVYTQKVANTTYIYKKKKMYNFCKCVQHLPIFMCLQYKFTL